MILRFKMPKHGVRNHKDAIRATKGKLLAEVEGHSSELVVKPKVVFLGRNTLGPIDIVLTSSYNKNRSRLAFGDKIQITLGITDMGTAIDVFDIEAKSSEHVTD